MALAAEREAQGDLTTLERRAGELRARTEGLQKLAASGEGFFTGVRAVLAAARSGELSGVVGPIASVLTVPAEVETAIEVALGGHLQDIVVERWADAEAAIALLKARRVGRATFQPLDTVRGGGGGGVAPSGAGDHRRGRRSGAVRQPLYRADARVARPSPRRGGFADDTPRVVALVGRLEHRHAGRRDRAHQRCRHRRRGGARSGILARERTLRELPRALGDGRARGCRRARTVLDERAVAVRAGREALAHCERLRRDTAQEGDDLRHRLGRFERDCRAVVESLGTIERQLADIDRAEAALGNELATIESGERDFAARLAALEQERATSLAAAQEGDQSGQDERSRLTALRAEAARAEERGRGLRRELAAARNQEIVLAREAADLARAARNWPEEQSLVTGETGQREALATAEAEAAALTERLQPLDATLAAVRWAEAEASATMNAANEEALRREATLGSRAVETARRRADRDALARRIVADLEIEEPEAHFAAPMQPLPTEERTTLEGRWSAWRRGCGDSARPTPRRSPNGRASRRAGRR